MGKVSPKVRKFRARVGRGKIMKPSTFQRIYRANVRSKGPARAARIAGKAYWNAARSKARRGTTRNISKRRR
jgi:hypothetical protein